MTMILRGRKLQVVLQLIAKGQLSDFQIAERLGVSVRSLEATRQLPMFAERIAQIQQGMAALDGIRNGTPMNPCRTRLIGSRE